MSDPIDLSLTVDGQHFPEAILRSALDGCAVEFEKVDFNAALTRAHSAPVATRMTGRILQTLKRKGVIQFDRDAQIWRKSWGISATNVTLPLATCTQTARLPVLRQPRDWPGMTGNVLCAVACFSLIAALITLNASFAWELGREADQFRAAFVVGLMALDLMRPFLVAKGFSLQTQGQRGRAGLAFGIAFLLSPVSILSSTAILSSSFLLGAEMNADEQVQTATLKMLRGEHTRRLAEAERLNDAWRIECDRGGCGPLAAEIETAFLTAQAKAQAVLERIEELTEASKGASDLLARMVVTFERLGVFGQGREILLPLFLAISLELGALFGPALLLGRRRSMP